MTSIKFKHTFNRSLSDNEQGIIIETIKSSILSNVNAEITFNGDILFFKVPFIIHNLNLFSNVNNGKFVFENNTSLTYEISFFKNFIIGMIFALLLALSTRELQLFLVVLIMFIVGSILNWLATKYKHSYFFNDILLKSKLKLDRRKL